MKILLNLHGPPLRLRSICVICTVRRNGAIKHYASATASCSAKTSATGLKLPFFNISFSGT